MKGFRWISFLKEMNSAYANIAVPRLLQDFGNYDDLHVLPEVLREESSDENTIIPVGTMGGIFQVINDPVRVRMHRIISNHGQGGDIVGVRENTDENSDDSGLFHSPGNSYDDNNNDINNNNTNNNTNDDSNSNNNNNDHNNNVNVIESLLTTSNGQSLGNTSMTSLRLRELEGIQSALGRQAVNEQVNNNIINLPFNVRQGDTTPLNEFTQNNIILTESFPFEFLLGNCPNLKKASIDSNWLVHANQQYSNKFAWNKEFNFLCFDQMQRHEAARIVGKKVKNNINAMRIASVMINSDPWQERLATAIQNPNAADSVNLIKEVSYQINT